MARCLETYLLQLHVLQIASNHHLQDDKQLPVANVSVAINIVNLEGESQFLFLVAFGAEGTKTRDEFLEVDITASIFIKNGDHAAMRLQMDQPGVPVGCQGDGQVPGG